MRLVDRLGIEYGPPNVLQRAVQWFGGTAVGSWLFKRTLHLVDRPLFRLTGGRVTLTSVLAGLPVLLLTTTGRRSGRARTTPLLGIPIEGELAVIGSNFGQSPTPGWVHNLEADPHAHVAFRDHTVEVVARPAGPDEVERAFARAAAVYPGYRTYRRRAAHRTIRVFVLSEAPRDDSRSDPG